MNFDFSKLNHQYLIQARDLAKSDPERAAVLLGMPIKLAHALADLSPNALVEMTRIKLPLIVPRQEPLWWSRLFNAAREGQSAEIQAVLQHASLIASP